MTCLPHLSPPGPWAVDFSRVSAALGNFRALMEVSAQAPLGGQTVIIGPNGAGKTTLVKSLLNQLPYGGRISFQPARPVIGYVPQGLDFDRHLPLSVMEYLALGLTDWPIWLGRLRRIRPRALKLLDQVRAADLADQRLGDLSGGELQRVLLASALSLSPDLLVLDEPATGVDIYGEQLLCELLDSLKGGCSIIMVSHDLATARAHADWVICLNRRVIAQGPPDAIFTREVLAATYGLHEGGLMDSPAYRQPEA